MKKYAFVTGSLSLRFRHYLWLKSEIDVFLEQIPTSMIFYYLQLEIGMQEGALGVSEYVEILI